MAEDNVQQLPIDETGMTDEVTLSIYGEGEVPEGLEGSAGENLPPIPDRPGESAKLDKWIDYCEALGASPESLRGETSHFVGFTASQMAVYGRMPKFTKKDLVELADRLGG